VTSRTTTRFLVIAGVGFALYAFPYQELGVPETLFQAYLDAYAAVAACVIRLFDPRVVVLGAVIRGRHSGVEIVKTCDAIDVQILLVAAMIAFGGSWWRRVVAAACALVVLNAVNVLRIASLYAVAPYVSPDIYETIHLQVWPFALAAFALFEFWLWRRWSRAGLS
jgi:exosortase/archaeosortase family protein